MRIANLGHWGLPATIPVLSPIRSSVTDSTKSKLPTGVPNVCYTSWAPHIFTKLLHALGNFSCSIPRPSFARMKSDASVLEEVVRQEIIDIACPFRFCQNIDVV